MHSFAPSLSFLLSLSFLASSLVFEGLPVASAGEVTTLNHTSSVFNIGTSGHGDGRRRRHSGIGAALEQARSTDLMLYPGRRAAGAEFTYFATGLGACGHFNVPSDFIVAMNMQQFDAGDHCGATITITAKGKTAQATIMDRCVGCGYNNLDFTEGLYRFFDPTMFGVVKGDWEYGSGVKKPVTTSKKPVITTSSVHHTSSKAPITTSSKATPSSSSVVDIKKSSASASPTASPSTTSLPSLPTDSTNGNLGNLFGALLNMGGLMMNTVPSST